MSKPLLTRDTAAEVVETLHTRHGSMLRNERFDLSASLVDGTVHVELALERRDRKFLYRMEAAKQPPEDGSLTTSDTLDLCLDFLDWYLGEYFREERDLLLPLDWQSHRFGDFEVLARGDVRNPSLDEAADAWLRGERPDPAQLRGSGR